MDTAAVEGRRIRIQGIVQGVGFRPWVYRTAVGAGVTGRVLNDSSGVTIDAFADHHTLDRFEASLHASPPPAARITAFVTSAIAPEALTRFVIVSSERGEERQVSIPPELATCDECVAEIFDPSSRRFRYAFTNCTNCGPRFTIATDVPYDRPATTMAPFVMCEACRREYEDVGDRRFHAQPIACPACGPTLTLHTSDGAAVPVPDPIERAAAELNYGRIVALKGLGGFHLACDATSPQALAVLRGRKRRDQKPFAVMVRTLADAEALAVLDDEERRLLLSPERPIVLAPKRPGAALAPEVAPRNEWVGVMLPYTPLHHLLLADAGRPLVMTSGNLSAEPIAYQNDEAVTRLRGIADFFLLHDRNIETRCDDSVALVVAGRPTVIRRSRGYVPRSVSLSTPVAQPVLACGALLKNTFCIASGEHAFLGPHIGDLENLETYLSYTTAVQKLERFLQVRPAVVACDLHPDYLSSAYARSRPEPVKVAVQHHHAHVVAAMAEHHLDGPVIGLAYDGTGYGTDGTSWGGELLVDTAAEFTRDSTFRPLPLAGGDLAVREPWRIALALIIDAFGADPPAQVLRLFDHIPSRELAFVRKLIVRGLQSPLAHGVGRYFDAFGALFLQRRVAAYEGQVALEWNQAADPDVRAALPFDLDEQAAPCQLDLRPAIRAAVFDWAHGEAPSTIAAMFHNTLAAATTLLVRRAAARVGRLTVVASGGCFQNARLAESIRDALVPEFDVRLHEQVPPGDGGIALGQAVAADAMMRTRTWAKDRTQDQDAAPRTDRAPRTDEGPRTDQGPGTKDQERRRGADPCA
jgi:hydrogenase maturation protein HypF